jgi:hypothetical protein
MGMASSLHIRRGSGRVKASPLAAATVYLVAGAELKVSDGGATVALNTCMANDGDQKI